MRAMKTKRCPGHESICTIWRKNNSQIEFLITPKTKRRRAKAQRDVATKELKVELKSMDKNSNLKGVLMYRDSQGYHKTQKFMPLHVLKISQKRLRIMRWVSLKELPKYFTGAQGRSAIDGKTEIKLYNAAHKLIKKSL